ncbi:hypothetical protein ACQY0O_007746 [Thecaphora frezii]
MSCFSFFKRTKPRATDATAVGCSCNCSHRTAPAATSNPAVADATSLPSYASSVPTSAAHPTAQEEKQPLSSSVYCDARHLPSTATHTGTQSHPCCDFSVDTVRPPAYSNASTFAPNDAFGDFSTPSPAMEGITQTLCAKIGELDEVLRRLSLQMHGYAEIMWQEHKTHDLFVEFFKQQQGWKVTPHAYGIETAWEAVFSHKPDAEGARTIGFQSELDALPGIGHACGHNLIAISGVAAALSVAHALVKHDVPGTVVLLGTPAEEGGGGKLNLLKAGAYKRMDACLMLHPAPSSGTGAMLAVQAVKVTFTGRTSHAGAAPWEGVNALDAAVLAYTNVSALRQQMHPSNRVHGIIKGENWAANVIPGQSELFYNVRSPTLGGLKEFVPKVQKCFEAAALATGCEGKYEWQPAYADVRNTPLLSQAYAGVMKEQYGQVIGEEDFTASTDFGNVCYALPALHAEYAIHLEDPKTQGNHTVGFTAAAKTKEAHERTKEAALGIAVTGARVLVEREFRDAVWRQWKEWREGVEGP